MLDKLETQNVVSQDGSDWVKMALDPFHDFNLKLAGLPDKSGGESVVRFFKQKVTIVRPSSLAATDKWDCHIFTLPIFDPLSLCSRDVSSLNWVGDAGAGDINAAFGLLNIVSGPADGEWFSSTSGATGGFKATAALQQISPSLNLSRRSLARVISCGFEVHNDTPSLYKGGSVTSYKCPQGDYDLQIFRSPSASDAATGYPFTCSGPWRMLRRPPDNVNQAMQMPSSVTYEAAKGVYVVNDIDLERSTYAQPSNMPLILAGRDGNISNVLSTHKELVTTYNSHQPAVPTDYWGQSVQYIGMGPPALVGDPCYRLTGMHTSGSYFNGLTPETILTLELHVAIESLPINDQSELALASPAACYDPFALQLYDKTIRDLKAAVPVSMNAKGDWWKMVGNTLADFAPTVANAIVPGSGIMVKGLIGAGRMAKAKYEASHQPKNVVQNGNFFRGQTNLPNQISRNQAAKAANPKNKKKNNKNSEPLKVTRPVPSNAYKGPVWK